jgi:drug/metabolite transporter (DMT)-like permease
MKSITATLFLVLSLATTARGQEPPAQAAAALNHQGTIKVWLGVALLSAGAVVAIPRSNSKNEDPSASSSAAIGLGMASGGGYLLLRGVHDLRKASQPQTTFGVMVGSRNGFQLHRIW